VCVGGMVLVSNTAVISKVLGIPGAVAGGVFLGIVVATALLAVRLHRAGPPVAAPVPEVDEPAPLH
jgi:hypothetical protein